MKKKRFGQFAILSVIAMLLAACGTAPVSSESTGLWDRYIIYNLSQLVKWLSSLMFNNYALGIILFTIIVLIVLTPLTKMQMDAQNEMAELQPELEKIRAKYPNRDRHSLEMQQAEQKALMDERGINQFASMLPLLIQLPVMIALYQAILRTPELKDGTFLWTHLSQPDPYFILPLIAAALTYYSTYLSTKANPIQNGMTKAMSFIGPIMIFIFGFTLPTAITLYWVISNAFRVVQILLMNNPYKIIKAREAKRRAEKEKQKRLRKELRRAQGKK